MCIATPTREREGNEEIDSLGEEGSDLVFE